MTSETVIRNPVPQEWVSPMVKALTIASDKPFNAVAMDIQTIEQHPVETTQTHVSEISAAIETEDYMKEHHSDEVQQIIEGHSQHHSEETKDASQFQYEVRITPEILEPEMIQGSQGFISEQHEYVQEEHIQMQSYQKEEMMQESIQKQETNDVNFPFSTKAPEPYSPFAKALSIAPDKPFSPTPQIHLDPVPLPEFTEPYFTPKMSFTVEPFVPKKQEECKNPFVEALTTAPERSYSPLPVKKKAPPVPDFMKELPPAKEQMSMLAALTVATDRPFTPVLYGQEHQAVKVAPVVEPAIQPTKAPPQPVVIWKKIQSPLPAKPASHIMPSAFVPLVTTYKPVLETYKPEQHVQEQPPRSFPPVTPKLKQTFPRSNEFGSPRVQVQAPTDEREYQQQMYQLQMAQQEMINQQMEQQRQQEMVSQQSFCEDRANQQKMMEERAQQEMAQREMVQQQRMQEERAYQHMLQQQKAQEVIANQQLVQQKIIQEQMSYYSQQTQQMSSEEQYHRQEQSHRKAMSKQPAQAGLHKADAIPSYQKNLPTYVIPSTASLQLNIQQYCPSIGQHEHPQIKVMQEPIKKPVTTLKPGQQFQPNILHQTFQPVGDDHETHNGKAPHYSARPISPSMINKPVPAIPHYQADIVSHQCLAVKSEFFDPRSPGVSIYPSPILGRSAPPYGHRIERAKSPAAGPPPDPLASRRSKTPTSMLRGEQYFEAKEKVTHFIPGYQEKEHRKQLRTPEIQVQQAETVEQQYQTQQQYQQTQAAASQYQMQQQYQAQQQFHEEQQQQLQVQEKQYQQPMPQKQYQPQQQVVAEPQYQPQQQVVAEPQYQPHKQVVAEPQYQPQQSGYSTSDSSFTQYQTQYQDQNQVGQQMTHVQATEDVKHLEQKAKSEVQIAECSPDNMVQIQRTKKVSEEFERTQKVKTIEIERSSTGTTQKRSGVQSAPQMQTQQIRYDPPHDIQMYNAQEKRFSSIVACDQQNICSVEPQQILSQNSPIPMPKQFGSGAGASSQPKSYTPEFGATSASPPVQFISSGVDQQKTSAFQQYKGMGQQKASSQRQYNASGATSQQTSSSVGQSNMSGQKLSAQGQFSSMGIDVQQKTNIPQQVVQLKSSVPKPTSVPVAPKKIPVAPNVSSSQGGQCVKKRAYETTIPKSQNQYYPTQTPPVSPVTRFQKSVTNPTAQR